MSNIDREFDEAVRYNKPLSTNQPKIRPDVNSIDDGFLQIFNTPEYKARQEQARRQAAQPNKDQQAASARKSGVKHVNVERFKQKERFSLKKVGLSLAVVFVIVLGILKILIPTNEPEKAPVVVPDGYISMVTAEEVVRGDTVYSIASEYYNSSTYSSTYGSLNDYVNTIIDTNNLSYDGDIEPYDVLAIPVIVDVDNECYQELRRLEQEINKIRQEEYWVDYIVKAGDSLSSIAAKASASQGETVELTKSIMAKNNLNTSFIYQGQHLKIVNPALGQLKIQFNQMKQALQESLKNAGSPTIHH